MIILKPREIFLTLFSVIFLILVLILGGCGGSGGGASTSGGGGGGSGAGTISLAWDAPTTNSDGSPLTDLGRGIMSIMERPQESTALPLMPKMLRLIP